jgi:CDP-diglyceride synthetase
MDLTLTTVILCSVVHLVAALYGIYTLGKYECLFTQTKNNRVLDVIHLVLFINFVFNTVFLYRFDTYLFNPCFCVGFSLISALSVLYYFIANKYLLSRAKVHCIEKE